MQLERYCLNFGGDKDVFEFSSVGPRGVISKRILFELIDSQNHIYNLAFGDINPETNELDDTVISDNGDSEKVLATVVSAVEYFFESHPYAFLYATGSTKSRTRLYQIGINRNLTTAKEKFIILGENAKVWEPFKSGIVYDAFLVRKKD